MISGDPISYKNGVIYIKTELVELKIEGQRSEERRVGKECKISNKNILELK